MAAKIEGRNLQVIKHQGGSSNELCQAGNREFVVAEDLVAKADYAIETMKGLDGLKRGGSSARFVAYTFEEAATVGVTFHSSAHVQVGIHHLHGCAKKKDWDSVTAIVAGHSDDDELSLEKLAVGNRDAQTVQDVKLSIVLGVFRKLMEETTAEPQDPEGLDLLESLAGLHSVLQDHPVSEEAKAKLWLEKEHMLIKPSRCGMQVVQHHLETPPWEREAAMRTEATTFHRRLLNDAKMWVREQKSFQVFKKDADAVAEQTRKVEEDTRVPAESFEKLHWHAKMVSRPVLRLGVLQSKMADNNEATKHLQEIEGEVRSVVERLHTPRSDLFRKTLEVVFDYMDFAFAEEASPEEVLERQPEMFGALASCTLECEALDAFLPNTFKTDMDHTKADLTKVKTALQEFLEGWDWVAEPFHGIQQLLQPTTTATVTAPGPQP